MTLTVVQQDTYKWNITGQIMVAREIKAGEPHSV